MLSEIEANVGCSVRNSRSSMNAGGEVVCLIQRVFHSEMDAGKWRWEAEAYVRLS